jgi:hypothetical protein
MLKDDDKIFTGPPKSGDELLAALERRLGSLKLVGERDDLILDCGLFVRSLELKPFADWHEDYGACIFYIPMTSAPPIVYCGTPHDSDWPWDDEDEDWQNSCWWHPVPLDVINLSH